MSRQGLATLWIVALMGFAGCGGDEGSVTLENFDERLTRAECDALFRCGGTDEYDAYDRAAYRSAAVCAGADSGDDITARVMRPYIDAGTVVFDAAAAEACIAATRRTCATTPAAQRACASVLRGTVPTGGGCAAHRECESNRCSMVGFGCGTCQEARGLPGSFCFFDFDCPSTLQAPQYCDDENTCVAGIRPDERTTDPLAGEECVGGRCAPGHYCIASICSPWRERGEACDVDEDSCAPGTICGELSTDPGNNVCVPIVFETRPGELCDDPWDSDVVDQLVVCDLNANLTCRSGVCARLGGDGNAGTYCEVAAECADGLSCVGSTCVGDPLPDGAACMYDVECASYVCDRLSQVCVAPLSCE
ncbi:MAG: hypothetical protein R3B40_04545 [Polyangiales bacterium]|nr:hypothetical protein [Myxococcales bacterium]MCB9662167.1 hypothetical protein [Sandaracinaceae bacterium]